MENEVTFGHPGDPTQAPTTDPDDGPQNEVITSVEVREGKDAFLELCAILGEIPDGRGLTVGDNPKFRALIEEFKTF